MSFFFFENAMFCEFFKRASLQQPEAFKSLKQTVCFSDRFFFVNCSFKAYTYIGFNACKAFES